MSGRSKADPLERIVRAALEASDLWFVEEEDERALGLDFYLPAVDVHIEVKQFHTERISEQMKRAPNVIAIQGMDAARLFAQMLNPGMTTLKEQHDG